MREMMPHIPVKKFTGMPTVQLYSSVFRHKWANMKYAAIVNNGRMLSNGCGWMLSKLWPGQCLQSTVPVPASQECTSSSSTVSDDMDRSVSISGGSGRATSYDNIKQNFSRTVNYLDLDP